MTQNTYTVIAKQAGDWWVGWVQEIPGVNAQERTKEELLISLRHALREAIEMNRNESRQVAESDYVEEPLTL